MALLNLNIHYTIWYLDIISPLSSSQHHVCAVYFDFSMGVGLMLFLSIDLACFGFSVVL
jgi:hypothetical protein